MEVSALSERRHPRPVPELPEPCIGLFPEGAKFHGRQITRTENIAGEQEGGEGAPPPQSDPRHGGAKRPTEEEDVYGGAERTRDPNVSSEKAKP
jgi:hypothetical protein